MLPLRGRLIQKTAPDPILPGAGPVPVPVPVRDSKPFLGSQDY